LAQYVSTIANGGYRLRPHVLKAIESGGQSQGQPGQILSVTPTEVLNRVNVDPEYIQIAREGMHMVAENPRGTAYNTFNGLPVDVAAKTGTAQTGYETDNALIMGFAPYQDPEIAFVVIVPRGGGGSETSGPIARKILEAYFGLDQEGNGVSNGE
jgi:cell division protein FtsI/penicillin-binding protein 2